MQVARQVEIVMGRGETMTIDLSVEIMDQIKRAFDLRDDSQVTDRHVKYYIVSAIRKMLEATGGSEETH